MNTNQATRLLQSRVSKRGLKIAELELLRQWSKVALESIDRALAGAAPEFYVRALEVRRAETKKTMREENNLRRQLGVDQKIDRTLLRHIQRSASVERMRRNSIAEFSRTV